MDSYKQGAKHIISTTDALDCLCECMALTQDCRCVTLLDPLRSHRLRSSCLKEPPPVPSLRGPSHRPVAALAQGNLGNLPRASATPAENPTTGRATVNAPAYMPHRARLSLVANIAQISMPAVPSSKHLQRHLRTLSQGRSGEPAVKWREFLGLGSRSLPPFRATALRRGSHARC